MSMTASLVEARELYQIITECEAKLDALDAKARTANISLGQVIGLLNSALLLIRRASGNEDIDQAILQIQRLIMALNLFYTTYMATIAATTPLGWAVGLVGMMGALGTGFMVLGDIQQDARGHRG